MIRVVVVGAGIPVRIVPVTVVAVCSAALHASVGARNRIALIPLRVAAVAIVAVVAAIAVVAVVVAPGCGARTAVAAIPVVGTLGRSGLRRRSGPRGRGRSGTRRGLRAAFGASI